MPSCRQRERNSAARSPALLLTYRHTARPRHKPSIKSHSCGILNGIRRQIFQGALRKELRWRGKFAPVYAGASIGYAGCVVDDKFITEDNPRYKFPGERT